MTAPVDWPLLDYAVCWAAGPTVTPLQDFWMSVAARTEGTTTTQRGKTYELDQVQPGEMGFTLRNDDGLFDPANSLSVLYPQVRPYRLCRFRAQYPATTNMLDRDQASAWYASLGSTTTSALPNWVKTGPALSGTLTVAPEVVGSNKYTGVLPTTATAGQLFAGFTGWSVVPGATYSGQILMQTAGSNAGLRLQLDWFNAAGSLISSSLGTALVFTGVTQQLTVTGAAPAGAAGARLSLTVSAAPTANVALGIYQVQVEQAGAASAWVTPGTWYSLYTGFIERWPQSWASQGNYGTVALDAVDLFGFLGGVDLDPAAYLEVLSLGPTFFYPLDEAGGATQFHDKTTKRQPATIATPSVPTMATVAAGDGLTSSGGYVPQGIAGPVVGLSAVAGMLDGQTVDLTGGGANPTGPATTSFTRMIAFRTPKVSTATGLNQLDIFDIAITNQLLASALGSYDANGNFNTLQVEVFTPTWQAVAQTSPTNKSLSDGGWHLLLISLTPGTTMSVWLDGVALSVSFGGPISFSWGNADRLGTIGLSGTATAGGLFAEFACVAEFPFLLSSTQADNLYEAFRYAWGTTAARSETSGSRYARILAWLAANGLTRVGLGSSVKYGPAVDLPGAAALDALQAVVDSEVGQHFIGGDGAIVFQGRTARFNPAPTVTFGENAGEIPYLGATLDFDPTLVLNYVTGSTPSSAATAASTVVATDATSAAQYGKITADRTVNTADSNELAQVPQAILYQNKQPLPRLETIAIDVGANASLWATLLGLELGTCVKVNRRPSNAPAISITGFVEQIAWSIGDDRSAVCTLQVSNAALHYFGTFDDATYGKFDSTLIFGF